MKLPKPNKFEWDLGNKDKNWEKHKVHFKEAEEVFLNKPLIIFSDLKHSFVEKRFQALGLTDKKRYLTVFFTLRNDNIRVISARDQSKKERSKYEK